LESFWIDAVVVAKYRKRRLGNVVATHTDMDWPLIARTASKEMNPKKLLDPGFFEFWQNLCVMRRIPTVQRGEVVQAALI